MTDEELAQQLKSATSWVVTTPQEHKEWWLAVAKMARELLLPKDLREALDVLHEGGANGPEDLPLRLRDAFDAARTGGTESDPERHWHKDGSSDTDPKCHRARVMFPKDMHADNKALAPGETCMLKSGGPEMTAVEILADGNIRCDFFSDLAGDFRTYDFAAVALRGTK